jgi:hypothetical protein
VGESVYGIGDKQEFFALAAKRYADVPARYMVKALEQPTLRGFIRAAFDNTVEFLDWREHPSSCFTLTGAISCGVSSEPAKVLLREMRLQNEGVRDLQHALIPTSRWESPLRRRTLMTHPALVS